MTDQGMIPRGRPVDASQLEELGKQAAHMADVNGISMNDAVVQTLGHAKLNAEQVRRVVEFANIDMFNRKYAAMSGLVRAVHVDGGPADPVHVIQSLNDAARPREVVVDSLEYSAPPDFVKRAAPFTELPQRTSNGVLTEVLGLQHKLSSAHDELVQSEEAAKERLSEAFLSLADAVKSASISGATPQEIFSAWQVVHPELAKIAYTKLAGLMKLTNTKVAGRSLNPAAKVVMVFSDFVKESKSAEAHALARHSVEVELAKVAEWLKRHGG